MEFPNKLSRLLKSRHDSQGRIAADLGVSQNVVGTWCRGEQEPRLSQAAFLARRFAVSLDYLADDALDAPPVPDVTPEERSLLMAVRILRRVHGLSVQDVSDAIAAGLQARQGGKQAPGRGAV